MPEGIHKADWDIVHQMACDIANAGMIGDRVVAESRTIALLEFLYTLHKKYGDHPALLATIGDYLSDKQQRMTHYTRALTLARQQGNRAEEEEILDSIKHLEDGD